MWYNIWYMKNPWIIVGVLAVVLIAGAVWYSSGVTEKNNAGIAFSPHVKGNSEAAVLLQKYSDFQCPACATAVEPVNQLLSEYGDQIRFEYKHFPLPIHASAEMAARAAEAAGLQGKFYEYHDLLFTNQRVWSASTNPMLQFSQYASELELDMAEFRRHVNASLVRDKVREYAAEGRALGITGTPTFFLNGERMVYSTYEEFAAQVVAALNPDVGFDLQ